MYKILPGYVYNLNLYIPFCVQLQDPFFMQLDINGLEVGGIYWGKIDNKTCDFHECLSLKPTPNNSRQSSAEGNRPQKRRKSKSRYLFLCLEILVLLGQESIVIAVISSFQNNLTFK